MSLHSKKAVIDNGRPKQLSIVVAKINIEMWNIVSDNTNNTESSYGLSGFNNESDSSDQNIYNSRSSFS